jgi:hypothetical protein
MEKCEARGLRVQAAEISEPSTNCSSAHSVPQPNAAPAWQPVLTSLQHENTS